MPDFNTFFPGSFLKAADFINGPQVFQIASLEWENVGQGAQQEKRPVMRFNGVDQGLVVNATNGEVLAGLFGNMTEQWIGQQIELYNDPNIMFGGKRTGGLRVRAPSGQAMPLQQPQTAPVQPVQPQTAPVQPGVQQIQPPVGPPGSVWS